jgi:hypothetical protein
MNTNYKKAVIYKIVHKEYTNLIYIGSTTNFSRRKNEHKCYCNNKGHHSYNLKVYKIIRDNGGWEMFEMIIIKIYPCNNRAELLTEEDRILMQIKEPVNKNRAILKTDEKKEARARACKKYNDMNKEKRKIYRDTRKEQKMNIIKYIN